ncbi:ABC transporter substrate-binding protein, partial [Salmonella enterica subsp. enterica serovar Typhi]|nr:ABC transporter substrate-binding protein [Salmonella enterica subsp. enterica serovar Typhi]
MKKILFLMMIGIFVLAACAKENESDKKDAQNTEKEEVTLKVASLIPPMTEILELVKPTLAEEGINLDMVVLSD